MPESAFLVYLFPKQSVRDRPEDASLESRAVDVLAGYAQIFGKADLVSSPV
jgi:hypothetical protein